MAAGSSDEPTQGEITFLSSSTLRLAGWPGSRAIETPPTSAATGDEEVGYDSEPNSFATRTITLRTSPAQDEAVRKFIEKIKRSPGLYILAGRNCGWFVRNALKEAGIETLNVDSPTDVFSDLEARNNSDPGSFYRR